MALTSDSIQNRLAKLVARYSDLRGGIDLHDLDDEHSNIVGGLEDLEASFAEAEDAIEAYEDEGDDEEEKDQKE